MGRGIELDEAYSEPLLKVERFAEAFQSGVHPDDLPVGCIDIMQEPIGGIVLRAIADKKGNVVLVDLSGSIAVEPFEFVIYGKVTQEHSELPRVTASVVRGNVASLKENQNLL